MGCGYSELPLALNTVGWKSMQCIRDELGWRRCLEARRFWDEEQCLGWDPRVNDTGSKEGRVTKGEAEADGWDQGGVVRGREERAGCARNGPKEEIGPGG